MRQRYPPAKRPHDKEQHQNDCGSRQCERAQKCRQNRPKGDKQQCGQRMFHVGNEIMQATMEGMVPLDPPNNEASNRHRNEAIALNQFGRAVAQQHPRQGHHARRGFGQSGVARYAEQHLPQCPAASSPHRSAHGDPPKHVSRQPFQAPCPRGQSFSRYQKAEVDKGKCQTIIQRRLGCERKSHRMLAALLRGTNLNVSGQNRIGRCHHRA